VRRSESRKAIRLKRNTPKYQIFAKVGASRIVERGRAKYIKSLREIGVLISLILMSFSKENRISAICC